jgi:hypothetical protein
MIGSPAGISNANFRTGTGNGQSTNQRFLHTR